MVIIQKFVAFWKESPIIQKIAKNFGYLFSSNIISSALSMLQGVFSVRLLGVAGFGTLGTITVFATTINKLTSFRMGELVIKYVGHFHETDEEDKAAAVFKVALLVELSASLLAFGLICLLAPLGARYFAKDDTLTSWFVIYGLIILANIISESSTGLLQYFDRFKNMAGLNIAQSVVTLGLIILAWWQNFGLLGVLVAYLIGKVIHAVGLSIIAQAVAVEVWGRKWWQTPIRVLHPHKKELLTFGVSTNINSTLSLISRDSSVLWVSYFTNPEQVGFYKLAMALTNYIQIPMAPMPQATYPELARAAARKMWEDFRYILKQGSRLAGAYSVLVALGLVIFGRPLISFVYKPEFLPTYNGLLIMLIGIVYANGLYWARSALLSLGLVEYATKVNVLVALITIAGYFVLLPMIGYMGAAILLAIGNVLGNSLVVLKVRSRLRHEEKLKVLEQGIEA